jgi:enamine deaminase RidA (YjgF/YER057c/UK114 family)
MPIEERLATLGLVLPSPMNTANLPFQLTRIDGSRCLLSGHVPLADDGSIATPLGKVGGEVTAEQGYEAARRCCLGMLASLKLALGDLDRVEAWLRVFGMVNAAPGFTAIPPVINGCSNLILEIFGSDVGAHTRSAVGMAELPFGVPVEIEAEVRIRG